MKIRQKQFLSIKVVKGLKTYVPPVEADFEMLEKTNKQARENTKGEVNKYDKKRLAAKAKFPLRTIELNEVFLKHNQEFYIEYDFFYMLSLVILCHFAISQSVRLVFPSLIETNLVMYLLVFTLMLTLMNLCRNTFSRGYFNLTDETKVELLMAIKAFAVVFVVLHYFSANQLFEIDLESAHNQALERVNSVLILMESKVNLPYEFTYSLFAGLAAILSFCIVRINVKFAYYFFMLNRHYGVM
jgi:hypothetical protein